MIGRRLVIRSVSWIDRTFSGHAMRWHHGTIVILFTAIGGGCSHGQAPQQPASSAATSRSEAKSDSQDDGLVVDKERHLITIDPNQCTSGTASFNWAIGSVRVDIVGRQQGQLVFDYTDEMEGGYTKYRCRVPIRSQPVTIRAVDRRDPNPGDFGIRPGIETSFSTKDCEVIESGNLLNR
jgi:hypothetical protein